MVIIYTPPAYSLPKEGSTDLRGINGGVDTLLKAIDTTPEKVVKKFTVSQNILKNKKVKEAINDCEHAVIMPKGA